MAFDILGYRDKFKDFYGDAPIDKVAKDVYTRGGFDKEYDSFDAWSKQEGIEPHILASKPKKDSAPTRLVKAFLQGGAEGLTTELPSMAGGALEFAASHTPFKGIEEKGRSLKEWAEEKRQELYGPEVERTGLERIVYEGTKMLAPSILPGGVVGTAARGVKGVNALYRAGKVAEATAAAKSATNIASGSVAGLFGLSQAQDTKDTAEKAGVDPGFAPYLTGAIEAAGEFLGTKYLAKLFRLDEADVVKRGGKEFVKDLLKTIGVEVGTEMGQSGGEAAVEKYSGIRPSASPIGEAIDVIGPTTFMTLLTAGLAGGANKLRETKEDPVGAAYLERLKIGAIASMSIKEGLQTGRLDGDPFTPENALEIIREGQKSGIYDDESIDRFKERYPQLRDGLNGVIADRFADKVAEQVLGPKRIIPARDITPDVPDFAPPEETGVPIVPKPKAPEGPAGVVLEGGEANGPLQTETEVADLAAQDAKREEFYDKARAAGIPEERIQQLKDNQAEIEGNIGEPPIEPAGVPVKPKPKEPEGPAGAETVTEPPAIGSAPATEGTDEDFKRLQQEWKQQALDGKITEEELGRRIVNFKVTETPRTKGAPNEGVAKILNDLDNTDLQISDAVAQLKSMEVSDRIKVAISDYERAVELDRKEYGKRSGLPEQAEEKLRSALKAETPAVEAPIAPPADLAAQGSTEGTESAAGQMINVAPDKPATAGVALSAVRTKDGTIYYNGVTTGENGYPEADMHYKVIENGNLNPDDVMDGGYVVSGKFYNNYSDALDAVESEKAGAAKPAVPATTGNLSRATIKYQSEDGDYVRWKDNEDDRLEYELNPPEIAANPGPYWEAGIRHKGWAKEHGKFKTKEEAVQWLDAYDTGKIDKDYWGPGAQFIDELFGKGTYEKVRERITPDNDAKVKAAITDAKQNGPSNEFRALFGGIDPIKAGTTNEAVAKLAKELGLRWEAPTTTAKPRQKLTTRFYTENGNVGSFDITDKTAGQKIAAKNLNIYDTFEEADQARKEWVKEEQSRKTEAKKKEGTKNIKPPYGRAGMAAFKKMGAVAGLKDPSDGKDYDDLVNYFETYYKAGLSGAPIPKIDIHPQDARAAYEAGRKDAGKKQAPKDTLFNKEPPGGWTEADKVPDKYRKKPAEAAGPTKLAGKYDNTGDKDASHENGSLEPERKFKKDLTKYAARLQSILGYEPDITTKGKKSKDTTVSTNIAPVGGDGHIILWKPNSEYGIYMTISVQRDYGEDGLTIKGVYNDIMYRATTKAKKYTGMTNQWAKGDISAEDLAEKIKNEVDFYDQVKGAAEIMQEAKDAGISKAAERALSEGEKAGEIEGADLTETEIDAKITETAAELGVEVKPFFQETGVSMKGGKLVIDHGEVAKNEAPAFGTENKIFTEDKANKAREILRKKLGGINMGAPLDPEIIQAGIDLAGYYIEGGARSFSAYASKMINDLGDMVRPYLKSFYMAVRNYPGFDKTNMDNEAALDEIGEDVVTLEDKQAIMSSLQKDDKVYYTKDGEKGITAGYFRKDNGGYITVVSGGGLTTEVFPNDIIKAERDGKPLDITPEKSKIELTGGIENEHSADGSTGTGTLEGDKPGSVPADGRGRRPGRGERGGGQADNERDESADVGGDVEAGGVAGKPSPIHLSDEGTDRGGISAQPGRERESDSSPSIEDNSDTTPASEPRTKILAGVNPGNYRITEADNIGGGTRGQKIDANLAAIRLIKQLDKENRYPTKEEQAVLAKYVGWGGLKSVFDKTSSKAQDQRAREELESLLTKEEYLEAFVSMTNAHYTSPQIIKSIYKILKHFGLTGGNILEPTYGVGNFIGLAPEDIAAASKFYGAELDIITAKIGQYLYPDSQLIQSGFQNAEFPYGKFDAFVGNPPFGDERIADTRKSRQEINRFKIHNYCIAKSGLHLKPGGIGAAVVTSRFLDTADSEARDFLSKNFKFLGAIRLPNDAFAKNAGTEVTTDLVFLQRLMPGETTDYLNNDWLETGATMTNKDGETITLNRYFANRPHLMIGDPSMKGTMYGGAWKEGGKGEFTLNKRDGEDIERAIEHIIGTEFAGLKGIMRERAGDKLDAAAMSLVVNKEDVGIGGFFMDGNKIYMRGDNDEHENPTYSLLTPKTPWTEKSELGQKRYDRIKGMLGLRAKTYELINAERFDLPGIEEIRSELNKQYDYFVKENGFLSESANFSLMSDDIKIEFGLESDFKKEITKARAKNLGIAPAPASAVKSGILKQRMFYPEKEILYAKDATDGYNISLSQRGRLDLDYIAQLTGQPKESVIKELSASGLIYQDPKTNEWIQEDEYLSGNVKAKFKKVDGKVGFEKNAEALKKVFPKDVTADEIFANPGATWIPKSIYEMFGQFIGLTNPRVSIYKDTGHFNLIASGQELNDINVSWENNYYGFDEIFNAVANNKPLIAYDGKGEGRVQNREQTKALGVIADSVRQTFFDWVFAEEGRSRELTKIYNDTQNTTIERKNDGSRLTMVGASPAIILRNTQRDGAWRMIQNKHVLLDHCVGAGKTFTIITGIMERVRMGLTNKAMIAVPNHLVGQWAADFMKLYPGARILAATKKDFQKSNRRRLFARIATGKYDAIIVGHSSFGFIPIERESLSNLIMEEVEHLERAHDQASEEGNKRLIKSLAKRIQKKREKIEELMGKERDNVTTFEAMGIDHLVVDESHEFKNLEYSSAMQNITGMGNPMGSKRAFDLYSKIRWLNTQKNYGLTFATGTPISNSLVEMYALLRYMNRQALIDRGLESFDAWSNAYASIESRIEYTASQKLKDRTVMATFNNLPEMLQMYKEFADIITMDDLKRIYAEQIRERNLRTGGNESEDFPIPAVEDDGRVLDVADATQEQIEYVDYLVARVERMEDLGRDNNPKVDNHLWVMSDARKMALDIRLVDPKAADNPNNKINRAAKKIKKIFDATTKDRGTQLVFCDLSTPSGSARKNADKFIRDALKVAGLEKDIPAKTVLDSLRSYQEKWGYIRNRIESEIESIDEHHLGETEQYTSRRERLEEYLEKITDDVVADLTTADTGFSVYDELKSKLIDMGVPEGEIKFIHDAVSDQQKQEMFDLVNTGKVMVLIGSSPKMGAGMNAQERLVALHHLDAPWRPSDVEQREGRIVRQGNKLYEVDPKGFKVRLIAYSTKNTFDAVMWQILARKGAMLDDFRAGKRSCEDASTDSASYSDFMAESTGNPAYKEKHQLENEIRILEDRKRKTQVRLRSSKQTLEYNKDAREKTKDAISRREALIALLKGNETFTYKGVEYDGNINKIIDAERDKIREQNRKAMDEYDQKIDAAREEAFKDYPEDYRGKRPSVPLKFQSEAPKEWAEYNEAKAEYAAFWENEDNQKKFKAAIKGIKRPSPKSVDFEKLAKSHKNIAAIFEMAKEVDALAVGDSLSFNIGDAKIEIKKTDSGWSDKDPKIAVALFDFSVTGDGIFLSSLNGRKGFPSQNMADLVNAVVLINKANNLIDAGNTSLRNMDIADRNAKVTLENLQFKDEEALKAKTERFAEVLEIVREADEEIAARRAESPNKYIEKDRKRFGDGHDVMDDIIRKEAAPKSEHYIVIGKNEFIPVDGKDVEVVDWLETFIWKSGKEWVVTEKTTGLRIFGAGTQKGAISRANERLAASGEEKTRKAIADAIENSGGTPYYRARTDQARVAEPTETLNHASLKSLLDQLAGKLKGIAVEEKDGTLQIRTRGGNVVQVYQAEMISVDEIVLQVGYGRSDTAGGRITGKFTRQGEKREITLRRDAGLWTISHEFVHFLESIGAITSEEQSILDKKIAWLIKRDPENYGFLAKRSAAERRAEYLGRALSGAYDATTVTGKIIQTIKDIIDAVVNAFGIRTAGGVARDIRTGKVYDRQGGAGRGLDENYSVKTTDRTKVFDANGKEVGFYVTRPEMAFKPGDFYIDFLTVNKELRGTGKFADILGQISVDAESEGAERVVLEVADEDAALGPMYKRYGFREAKSKAGNYFYISVDKLSNYVKGGGNVGSEGKGRVNFQRQKKYSIRTDAFKKWFGNSQVVDENGEPLVVYKGMLRNDWKTGEEINEINSTNGPWAGFFTSLKPVAKGFEEAFATMGEARTLEVYLSIKNPYVIDAKGQRAKKFMFDDTVFGKNPTNPGALAAFNNGYDGVIIKNTEDEGDVYIPKSPNQIKSATDNVGTFDENNPDIRYSFEEDLPKSKDPKVLNRYLKDETDAFVHTMMNKLHPKQMTWLETILKSPEWFDHPQMKAITKIFMRDRNEIYHETFNNLNLADDMDTEQETISEAAKALKNKGLTLAERFAGKVSPEYQKLQEILDEGDTSWQRNTSLPLEDQIAKFEQHIRRQGATEDTIRVWKLYRQSYDKALDLMTAQLRRMIEEITEEANLRGEKPDVSELSQTLKGALAQMKQWKGFYAPRLREMGNWKVQAYKEHGPMKENREWYREHKGSELSARRLAQKLQREGWKIHAVGEVERLPESVYQDVKSVATAKLIDSALEKMSKKSSLGDKAMKLNEEVLRAVSDEIKARGFRSTMIHRGRGNVVRGFIEDPIQRHLQYINNVSGGIAKARSAKMAMKELHGEIVMGKQVGGIDPAKDPKAYQVATNYIEEQLRNSEPIDRMIGLAKSIATFKFLGFNLRSLAVNTTAIVTTAPAAIHQYALGGKGSLTRIIKELAAAGKDYAGYMAGKAPADQWEQAFLNEITKLGWDDAQYTREALGEISKTHSRVWSSMMDASMYLFGKSEQWNRGTTMLAAYRLARKQGMNHIHASEAAKNASDKAHGVYGKSTMPMWAMGTNPAAKIGQMFYVYQKFGHNYLQMLYDMGAKKHNIKGLMFATLSPLVLAGAAAAPLKEVFLAMFAPLFRLLFDDDRDPEKWVWDEIRKHLGAEAEKIGRHGLTGAMGVDISSSLSAGVGIPKNFIDLTGAIGGVATEIVEAKESIRNKQYGRAAEHLLPTGLANPLRAMREATEGATTRNNRRVWDEKGKPYLPSAGETAVRAVGFRSTDQATISERTWEGHRQQAHFSEMRDRLYERYRAWMLGKRDRREYLEIVAEVREYNRKAKGKAGVSQITTQSLQNQARRMAAPSKNERAILQ